MYNIDYQYLIPFTTTGAIDASIEEPESLKICHPFQVFLLEKFKYFFQISIKIIIIR